MKSFKTLLQELRTDARTGRYRPAKHKAEYEDEGEYDNLVVVLENKFRDRLEALFGMEDHPKRTLLYSLVSDYRRSGGLEFIIDVYLDLVELVKDESDGSVQGTAPARGKPRNRAAAVSDLYRGKSKAGARAKGDGARGRKGRDDADRKVLRAGKDRGRKQGRVGRSGKGSVVVRQKKT